MTYATQNDLIDRVGERLLVDLTDREDIPTGVIDADAVNRALADADAEINGYLQDRYKLPLIEVPPALVAIASILAISALHINELSDKLKRDYETAQRRLREIASGMFKLPIAGIEPADVSTSGVRFTDRERPATEATMKGFI